MVFRRESKADTFQRQLGAIRQQLGTTDDRDDEAAEQSAARATTQATPMGSPPGTSGFNFGGFGSSPMLDQPDDVSRLVDVGAADVMTPVVPVADDQTSVIAHDTTWKGDLQSDGALHVHGRVEGTLVAKQDIYVAEEADVDATITASNVVIAGLVKGTIRCGARFEVLPQGRVTGDVQAPALIIHEGANINGQVRMGVPEGLQPPAAVPQRSAVRR